MRQLSKKIFSLSILLLITVFAYSQITAPDPSSGSLIEWLSGIINWAGDNWGKTIGIVLGFLTVVVRITPTEKDNDILKIVVSWLDWTIPNRKKGGGVFPLNGEDE